MVSLYVRLIAARVRAQMQYKISFVLELLGFTLVTGLEFALIAIMLARFNSVGGWQITEIALLYGLTAIGFGLAEMVWRGFDAPFERMMQQGGFDAVLIRPLGSYFQVLTSDFQLIRLGRMLQGAAALIYACAHLPIIWTPARLALVVLTIASGAGIYGGLIVIGATICFWTVKTPEVINIFTFGGEEATSYPLSIYNQLIRNVFLFMVPIGFSNYPTALLLLGRSDPHGLPAWLAWCAPLVSALFLTLALMFWRLGVSKYTSTGS